MVNVMKKSFTARESTQIGLNFSKKNHCPKSKACAKTDSLKNAKNLQKMANIGTLSLVFRLTMQTFDVCRKNSMRPCDHEDFKNKY